MDNTIIEQAKRFCIKYKMRLTKPRIEVLRIILKSSKPIGAYDILEKLTQFIDRPKPQTVYRAIDFWLKTHFIHRIKTLNAYVICKKKHGHKGFQFMLCRNCGVATESLFEDLPNALMQKICNNEQFLLSSWTLEMSGLCKNCLNKHPV